MVNAADVAHVDWTGKKYRLALHGAGVTRLVSDTRYWQRGKTSDFRLPAFYESLSPTRIVLLVYNVDFTACCVIDPKSIASRRTFTS